MNEIATYRRFYADFIVRSVGADRPELIEAFAAVPREDHLGAGPGPALVGSGYLPTLSNDPRLLYQDIPIGLATDRRINNGQPTLHARCLNAAAPRPGDAVVHIGAGTGYYSAVLAMLVGATGSVLVLEREPDLAERAAAALASHENVRVEAADAVASALPPCDVV